MIKDISNMVPNKIVEIIPMVEVISFVLDMNAVTDAIISNIIIPNE